MLVIHPSSSCDICLETYFEVDASGQKRVPHATECGHVFCKQCIDSLPRLLCPLCRSYLDPRAIRRLHVETTPATTPNAPSYAIKSEDDADGKESLKERLIAMVREGADGPRFQALLHEASTWLKDRSRDEHWDLRALYLLVVRYQQMHKDQQGAQLSLYKATNEFQETHRRYQRREQEAEREIARLHGDVQAEREHSSTLERQADEREARWSRKYENVMDEVRALREQIESFSRRAGSDRSAVRPSVGSKPSLLSMSKPRSPSSDDDDDNELLKPVAATPVQGGMDHFSPLPAHLSPAPAPMNAFSPLYEHLVSEYPDDETPVKEQPPPPASARRSKPSSPDGAYEKADYVSASTTKPMAISGVNAVAARFYDMLGESSANGSSSLPHPLPATYYNKRQEKQREQASLSRNSSSSAGSASASPGRMSSKMRQRVTRLQLQLVPDSSDEGEVNARHQRMHKLADILSTPLVTTRSFGETGEEMEGGGGTGARRTQGGDAPAPPPAPPPPPPHWQCTTVSTASTAAQALERERERRRKESGGSYASSNSRGTPAQEPPASAQPSFVSSNVNERPRPFMERRDSNASARSGYESKVRRQVALEA